VLSLLVLKQTFNVHQIYLYFDKNCKDQKLDLYCVTISVIQKKQQPYKKKPDDGIVLPLSTKLNIE